MYIELPHNGDTMPRYRYVPVEITPHDFHRHREDKTCLIVDSFPINTAVRDEYWCYGSIMLFVPNRLYDADGCVPCLYLNIEAIASPTGENSISCPRVIVTDEELTALFRMRYPDDARDPDIISDVLETYHYYTNGEIIHIKIDNPPPNTK